MTVRRKYKHFCSLLKVEDSGLSTEVTAIKVIQFMRDKEQQEVLEKLLPIIQEPEGPLHCSLILFTLDGLILVTN